MIEMGPLPALTAEPLRTRALAQTARTASATIVGRDFRKIWSIDLLLGVRASAG
jgi:hypothetical protein